VVAAGCTIEYCLVYYERGGRRSHVARGAVSLDAGGDSIRVGRYGARRLATIDDVRNAILSGAIKGPAGFCSSSVAG
jgi:hypothetical protein